MLQSNTRKINQMMVRTCAISSLAMLALLILNHFGIFNFGEKLKLSIGTIGFINSLSPLLLYLCHVPDAFLKYYTAAMLSILIGLLGCFNGIGIYITFVLVPVASCLYFDAKFTWISAIISYLVMTFSVYINSMGKMEVTYRGWSHIETFRAYIIGFTIEYIVICLFLLQIMKRARALLDEQHEALLLQQAQDYRYKLLVESTYDVIFELSLKNNSYKANRSLYSSKGEPNSPVAFDNWSDLTEEYPVLVSHLRKLLEKVKTGGAVDPFELDLSYTKNEQTVPLWYYVECFVVHDGNDIVGLIGKLTNITEAKLSQERLQSQRLSSMYVDSINLKKNTIYQLAMEESSHFTENEFEALARGHRFIAQILEELQYAVDLRSSLQDALSSIGGYFHLDRICIIETDLTDGSEDLAYQWHSLEKDALAGYLPSVSRSVLTNLHNLYNAFGYIEINPKFGISTFADLEENPLGDYMQSVLLGTQIWIPTLSDGEYNGAIIFDRYDQTPYTIVEKFLFSELVNTITAYVMKLDSEEANKAKSNFLSTMSHEIRTPMNAIVGMTEVALREDMSPSVKKCLKTVQSSSFGLLTLINDILDFSKIEAGKFDIVPEKFHILSLMNDVKEIVKARNAEKLELILQVDENIPSILYGDVVRIKQVMINFCTNAIKYTDKGSVTIRVFTTPSDTDHCTLTFSVKDTGIGIRKEDLSKLFKSYGQVDQNVNHHKEGTGLGLAISKQLIDLMDGSVRVNSEYGKGSEFLFELPLKIIDKKPAGKLENFHLEDYLNEEKQEKTFTAPDAKILIVDDTPINLMVASSLMRPLKMQIETANSGFEAIQMIEKNTYDLIFMDHFMPDMDGVETTQRIRAMEGNPNQNIPIIALTADAMSGVKEKLLSEGMNDFLSKPIMVKLAFQMIARWLPSNKVLYDENQVD